MRDRPGHDRRYAIDPTVIATRLGFEPKETLRTGLARTVDWYLDNEPWWRSVMDGSYRNWIERQYGAWSRRPQSLSHSMTNRTALDALPNGEPRLTIGMPIYNNGSTISRALDSLLAQSFQNFRLLISDDGSSDSTCEICDAYAARDSRVTVFRQPVNLNYGNFRYVLQRADTPLFMFAAGDDYWHVDLSLG